MIEQRETWKYKDTGTRILKDAEVAAIETWYDSARDRDPPARRLSEIGRHATKAKTGDAAPRFGRYSTKTGAMEAPNTRPTNGRGQAAWHAIQAALGLQYGDRDEELAVSTQADDSEEEGHIASPVKRRRCEPVGHAEASCATSCGGGGELANARIPDGSSAEGKLEYRSSNIGQGQLFGPKDFEPVVTRNAMPSATDVASDALDHAARRFIVAALDAVYVDKKPGDKARTLGGERAKVRALELSQPWLLRDHFEHQNAYHVCSICGSASCDGLSCNPYFAVATVEQV
jgi:hypothetical protein